MGYINGTPGALLAGPTGADMRSPRIDTTSREPSLAICGIESAARLLIHARNSHGSLRSAIRAAIHADIAELRRLRHG